MKHLIRRLWWLLFACLTAGALLSAWFINRSSLLALKQVTPVNAGCDPLEPSLRWSGELWNDPTSRLGVVVAAAGGLAEKTLPGQNQAHDAQQWAWFTAKRLIAQGQYAASFPYLQQAHIAGMLTTAGHFNHGDWGCGLFNWLMAVEMKDSEFQPSPDWASLVGYTNNFIADGRAQIVIDAYTRLLAFQPERTEWRLVLARAYLALEQLDEARRILEPLLSSSVERATAQALLDAYLKTHP